MASRSDYRKLTTIIEALTKLRTEVKPENEENGDAYDMTRAKITTAMQKIKDDLKALQVFKNDRDIIEMKAQLRRGFEGVQSDISKFGDILKTIAKERTKEPARRDARVKQGQKWAEMVQEELVQLAQQARSINVADVRVTGNGTSRDARREIEKERRRQRKERRRQRGSQDGGTSGTGSYQVGDEDIELDMIGPGSEQEQAFMKQVEQSRQEEEAMLQQISQGLTELHELALTLNKLLKQSRDLIDDVDLKMDKVQDRLDKTNEKLEKLLKQSGGMSRWCPLCICCVIILACAAFLFNKV